MPEEPDLSHWPTIWKHQDLLSDLFPRISFEDRDVELEEILSASIPPRTETRGHEEHDVIEASRRIREAIRDDAYMCWTPCDRDAFADLLLKCAEALTSFESLKKHNLKNLRIRSVDSEFDLLSLLNCLRAFSENGGQLIDELKESVPSATAATNTVAFSLIQRLDEAWFVLSERRPSFHSASGCRVSAGFNSGAPFQECLQAVADHLDLKRPNGAPLIASSALKAWLSDNGTKQPPTDTTSTALNKL